MQREQWRAALDVGGTFTDLALVDDRSLVLYKVPTTHQDPLKGISEVFHQCADSRDLRLDELLPRIAVIIHSTTRGINAIVTHQTARTALIVTAGHPDILTIREGGHPSPFDRRLQHMPPYIPPRLTFEVPERILSTGVVHAVLDRGAARSAIREAKAAEAEAVAVCLLWSIVNPIHERAIGRLIEEILPGIPYTLSHELAPFIREFRRASAAAIDASLKPVMSDYLGRFDGWLSRNGYSGLVYSTTSSGNLLPIDEVAKAPIHTLLSGPASAPVAGRHFAAVDLQSNNAVVADIGGTTSDISLVRGGHIPMTGSTWIGPEFLGYITGFPAVDVRSIGAGGGSIARLDAGGLLQVGPDSAGSIPGPACYARGGSLATLTDACLVVGYLDPAYFLGGAMKLDRSAAEEAIDRHVAHPWGTSLVEAAAAIVEVATERTAHAIDELTIRQGIDLRGSVLVAGGGAGGLCAMRMASRLECKAVIFPAPAAALSSAGALLADMSFNVAETFPTVSNRFDYEGVRQVLQRLRSRLDARYSRLDQQFAWSIGYSVDARYSQQIWELDVPMTADALSATDCALLTDNFHQLHFARFGVSDPTAPVEFLTWRGNASATLAGQLPPMPPFNSDHVGVRDVFFRQAGWVKAHAYSWHSAELTDGVSGPAIILSPITTIILEAGDKATRTPSGSIVAESVGRRTERLN